MAASQRSLLYPKLFISNGIVTRVSVWYLTFRDTRTLGELLFGDKEKGAAHRQETTYYFQASFLGELSPYVCGNLFGVSVVMYHIDGLLSHTTTEPSYTAVSLASTHSAVRILRMAGALSLNPKLFNKPRGVVNLINSKRYTTL